MATDSGDGGNTDQLTSPAKGFGSGASTAYEPPAASSMSGSTCPLSLLTFWLNPEKFG